MKALSDPLVEQAEICMRRWVDEFVLGLNLCPFAHAPHHSERIRYQVSRAKTAQALLADLAAELQYLRDTPPAQCATTLLIITDMLRNFTVFNDFFDLGEALLCNMGFEGEVQLASFHPDYLFADEDPDDASHYSNRAPLPVLHLIREDDVSHAMATCSDPDAIYLRNIETLRALGCAALAEQLARVRAP